MDNLIEKITYEIYVKSFYDSNNDGVGDLQGIIYKLKYLQKLGIGKIILDDLLIDSTDSEDTFKVINPLYGNILDFDSLVDEAEKLGIDVGIKLAISNTSVSHKWFLKAKSKDYDYQNYYFFKNSNSDDFDLTISKNWYQVDNLKKSYFYLHTNLKPELNWKNPNVVKKVLNTIQFFINHGVKLIQLQDAQLIGKRFDNDEMIFDTKLTVKYLDTLDYELFSHYSDLIVIIEHLVNASNRVEFKKIWNKPNFATYSNTHLLIDYQKNDRWTLVPYDFEDLRHVIHKGAIMQQKANRKAVLFWDNSEQSRALNRFILNPEYYKHGAKLLAVLLLTGKGIPMIYMGEEIGMQDPKYDLIDDYLGIETKQAYARLLAKGYTKERAFFVVKNKSNDNNKIPMQWDTTQNGGFSTVNAWIKPGDYLSTNVEYDLKKQDSIFNFYKKLIKIRKKFISLQIGEYQPAYEQTSQVLAFIRSFNKENLLVLTHFGSKDSFVELPADVEDCTVLLSNYNNTELTQRYRIRPYEALIIKY